jgi:putative ABC transport system permease protein
VALPLGCGIGYVIARITVNAFTTELFRIPLAIEASTYGVAVLIGLGATLVSAFMVRRRVDRLDLIAVLKTRE